MEITSNDILNHQRKDLFLLIPQRILHFLFKKLVKKPQGNISKNQKERKS